LKLSNFLEAVDFTSAEKLKLMTMNMKLCNNIFNFTVLLFYQIIFKINILKIY